MVQEGIGVITGINTNVFKGHSIRAAASSCARHEGRSMIDILGNAGWSSDRTFKKHYSKIILSYKNNDIVDHSFIHDHDYC